MPPYTTIQQVFDQGFPARFNTEASHGENCSYQFVVKNAGLWRVAVVDGALSVTPDSTEPTDVTFNIEAEDMLKLANGTEGLQLLFMTGRLGLQGDLAVALKLVRFFPV